MKKSILLFFFLLASAASYCQLWMSQSTGFTPDSSSIRNVCVIDTSVAWISAMDGSASALPRQDYSMTTDGGATWVSNTIPIGAGWNIAMITAIDAMNAWAIFDTTPTVHGEIWHTMDGGTIWTRQAPATFSTFAQSLPNAIHFWDSDTGVVVGNPVNGYFEIYTTVNGGATWDSVLVANIPIDTTGTEKGWATHIDVVGDTVWFDTNLGRVFRSVDRGHAWTVAPTDLLSSPGLINICFYSSMNGIARLYDDTTISNTVVETSDGGLTWSPLTPTGILFGHDIKRVPGAYARLVSTGIGALSGYAGSSFSTDGGHNWTMIENGIARGALGIADSSTMWCGGYTTSPTSDGIYKYLTINSVPCGDPSISPGTSSADNALVCGFDTVSLSTTGVVAPVTVGSGIYSGVSWVISSASITGSTDPLSDPSVIQYPYAIAFPAPADDSRIFINDGTVIDGLNYSYGVYYFTPVVFGNANGTSAVNIQDLALDVGCTYTGTSVAVDVLDPAVCNVGIKELNNSSLRINAILRDRSLEVIINSAVNGKALLEIVDLTGRIIYSSNLTVVKGKNTETINVSKLNSGVYLINAEINGTRATTRIMKY